jgi:trigger factor
MSVVVSMEEVGPCRHKLRIEVPGPAVDAEQERLVAEYSRQAKIPGFRKGKVPVAVVRKRFREDIEREVVERLVPRYWRQAEQEKQLDALDTPSVGEVEFAPGQPLRFSATVETRPEIHVRNVKDLALPELSTAVAPDEVDKAIDELRREVSEWPTVERAAGRGDLVAARVSDLGAAEPAPDPLAFEVGDANVWEELSVAASGLSVGQSAEFDRREPVAEGAEAPPAKRYRVEVTEVRERKLPELTDEFAKRIGNFADVPALKRDVESRIAGAKRLERRRQREQAALDQLRERHTFPLPEGVVEHEVEHLLREYAESLASRGVDLERAPIDWKEVAAQAKPQAERRVQARLLLDAIAESESIKVEEQDVERTLTSIARSEGTSSGAVRQTLEQQGRLRGLIAQLRREKTLNRLTGEENA